MRNSEFCRIHIIHHWSNKMTRVSIKDLELQVARINKLTGSPLTPWGKVGDKLKANIGNYHLDQAYGGIKLVKMYNEGGGIEVITRSGYGSKKELYYQLDAIITTLEMKVNSCVESEAC